MFQYLRMQALLCVALVGTTSVVFAQASLEVNRSSRVTTVNHSASTVSEPIVTATLPLIFVQEKIAEKAGEQLKAGEAKSDSKVGDKKADDKLAKENDEKSRDAKSKDNNNSDDMLEKVTGLKLMVTAPNIAMSGVGTGAVPEDAAAKLALAARPLPNGIERGATYQQVHWQAPHFCYYPLYFEDAMLERHGHVRWGHAQPIASGIRFFSTIPMLPYLKTISPPCQARCSLGHFRPGDTAPCLQNTIPWNQHAAVVEALSLGGFFWAMPL